MPPHPLKRRFVRLLALVAVTAAAGLGPALAAPVLDREFADPDIVKVGGTYHAYATNGDGRNVQHATSRDLKRWKADSGDVLPVLGGWAAPRRDLVWAPEVYDSGDGFTLYYTAHDRASDRQCIGVARAWGGGGGRRGRRRRGRGGAARPAGRRGPPPRHTGAAG
ncbi:family 43 glycosylhydrolase, partial [Streptomyces sp. NPDC127110]|uniref:family 43 glycosylhydrolase n=1 Tax=Streptomyces sp. NPDC127110 TaxID=3345362 RepID=UPI00362F4AB3